MNKLLKKKWFNNICICAGTLAAIIALAIITPPKKSALETEDDTMQIEAAAIKDGEGFAMHKDTEACESESAAAIWIDDEVAYMSADEVADFEKVLYSCETKQEYRALMETIVYYNKDIDISSCVWFGTE